MAQQGRAPCVSDKRCSFWSLGSFSRLLAIVINEVAHSFKISMLQKKGGQFVTIRLIFYPMTMNHQLQFDSMAGEKLIDAHWKEHQVKFFCIDHFEPIVKKLKRVVRYFLQKTAGAGEVNNGCRQFPKVMIQQKIKAVVYQHVEVRMHHRTALAWRVRKNILNENRDHFARL